MSNTFKWVDIKEEQPTHEGKYLVMTRTTIGNTHRVDSHMTINKDKVHFNVSNQIVTHWLKEI